MGLEAFTQHIKKQSEAFFSAIPQHQPIQVFSHLDADGLSSAAVVTKMLTHLDKPFTLRILPTLDNQYIKEFNHPHIIVIDLGSGQLSLLKDVPAKILVLDHHEIEQEIPQNVYHCNPREFGLDGNMEISGAGVGHLWAHTCASLNTHHFALCGAIGDIQEQEGFRGVNKNILDQAVQHNIVQVHKELKIFGCETKTLVKALQFNDLKLGFTANSAQKFLANLGIATQIGEQPVRYADLTESEKNQLLKAVKQKVEHDDIVWNGYKRVGEKIGTKARDLRETSTLLNACGRLEKPSIGVGFLLNDPVSKQLASVVSNAYKQKIVEAIKWFKSTQHDNESKCMIIRADNNIKPTMIGTLASMIAKQDGIEPGTFILSLAHAQNNKTKVSLRVAGDKSDQDLSEVINNIVEHINHGQAGGHAMAAGAIIDTQKEDEFIQVAKTMLIAS